jgi:Domain of unknown function (DUF4181)
MFWVKFSLIAIIVYVLIVIIQFILRKVFNIRKVKKGFFSYNHINELHRIVDRWIRRTNAITFIILIWVSLYYDEAFTYLLIVGVVFFLVVDYAVRSFFELKYSEFPKQAILTLAEMFLILIAIFIVFQFGLLGSNY